MKIFKGCLAKSVGRKINLYNRQEVKNAAGTVSTAQIEVRTEQILDLSDQKEMPDEDLAMNLVDLMNSFRRV